MKAWNPLIPIVSWGDEPPRKGIASIVLLVMLSVLCSLLVCYFFCPRFAIWFLLDLPNGISHPETNRAVDTLKQLAHPLVTIENPSNQVIGWRLFFPILGHALHLPAWAFLGLPHLGCLLVLALAGHLVIKEAGSVWDAFRVMTLMATGSWFFVSMGWLSYFDSWFLLGLLVVTFVPSAMALVLACLLTPWVDERFVMALPMCFFLRAIYLGWIEQRQWQKFLRQFVLVAALVVPYVLIRLWNLHTGDAVSNAYLQSHLSSERLLHHIPASRYLQGWWQGMRGAWLFVGILLYQWQVRCRWYWGVLHIMLFVFTLAFCLAIAGDLSRSMAVMMPAALLGMLFFLRQRSRFSSAVLTAVVIFNLLMPAAHVVSGFDLPLWYLPIEINRYQTMP